MGLVMVPIRMLLPGLAGKLVEPPLTFAADGAGIVSSLDQGDRAQERITLPFVAGRIGLADQSSGQKQDAKQNQASD